jgi:hypothetical protein
MSSTRSNGNQLQGAEEKIRSRAYELYQKRGGQDGRALDDWIQAETEFLRQSSRGPTPPPTRINRARKPSN